MWSIINLAKTGDLDGHLADEFDQIPDRDFASTFPRTARLLLNFAEVPGAAGWWASGFVFAAVLAGALAFREASRTVRVRNAGIAALIGLFPLVVLVLTPIVTRGYRWFFFHVGRPDLGLMDLERGIDGASEFVSLYGPIGLLLLASVVVLPFLVSRGSLPPIALLLGSAPILYAVVLALGVTYEPWWGRFFAFPVALAVATAGLYVRDHALVWGLVAIAATTVVLTLGANDEKPLAAWSKPRPWVQTRVGPGRDNGLRHVIRFAEEAIPDDTRLGLAIRSRDWSYPFFGDGLDRVVRFVPSSAQVRADLQWLVVAPTRDPPQRGWATAFQTSDGWRVLRRERSATSEPRG